MTTVLAFVPILVVTATVLVLLNSVASDYQQSRPHVPDATTAAPPVNRFLDALQRRDVCALRRMAPPRYRDTRRTIEGLLAQRRDVDVARATTPHAMEPDTHNIVGATIDASCTHGPAAHWVEGFIWMRAYWWSKPRWYLLAGPG